MEKMLPYREYPSLCNRYRIYRLDPKQQEYQLPHTFMPKAWQQDQPAGVSFLQHFA
jgi:hypothetical protein